MYKLIYWFDDNPEAVLGALVVLFAVSLLALVCWSEFRSDAACEDMCVAVSSHTQVRAQYGCLCENGRHFQSTWLD